MCAPASGWTGSNVCFSIFVQILFFGFQTPILFPDVTRHTSVRKGSSIQLCVECHSSLFPVEAEIARQTGSVTAAPVILSSTHWNKEGRQRAENPDAFRLNENVQPFSRRWPRWLGKRWSSRNPPYPTRRYSEMNRHHSPAHFWLVLFQTTVPRLWPSSLPIYGSSSSGCGHTECCVAGSVFPASNL